MFLGISGIGSQGIIWNKSWFGGALGECEPLKGQGCPVGCWALGKAELGTWEWEQQCHPSCWVILKSELCVPKTCPGGLGSSVGLSKGTHWVFFREKWSHTLLYLTKWHIWGCRFSFYVYFISGGGRSFSPTLLSSTWDFAESKPGPEQAKSGLLLLVLWLKTGCGCDSRSRDLKGDICVL